MGEVVGSRPLIGIPCFAASRAGTLRPVYGNNQTYVHAVERAGGVPLLIPPMEDPESLAAIRGRLDGLLLSGGGDLDPALYGEKPLPQCGETEAARDRLEMELTRWALAEGRPILGICRGIQLLNVVRGGSLYQDIATQRTGAIRHDCGDLPRTHRAHQIEITPTSRLAAILGDERPMVNSLHHQAVNRLGDGFKIVARAEDGIVEAVELEGHPFVVAVQYHPEELAPADDASRRLFAAFVQACRPA